MQRHGLIRDWLVIFKPRIAALLVFVALVAAVVANGGMPAGRILWPLLVAGLLASAGASALNNYLDRDIDGLMERTRRRPIPSGRVSTPDVVLLVGVGLLALSAIISLSLNLLFALFTVAGAFIYIVIYTWWLKRRSIWNIIIGGGAGSCAVLAGWTAVSPQLSWVPIMLSLLIFLWTPSHFWSFVIAHEQDYRRARTPMLPTVAGHRVTSWVILIHTLLFTAISLALYFLNPFRASFLVAAVLLGAMFIRLNLALLRGPNQSIAWRNYKFSGIYLLGIFSAMFVDTII